MSEHTLYTVGHSNRTLDELLGTLVAAGIEVLVDVRARPASRRNPQFNEPALREALARTGIGYRWAGRALGGMRAGRPESPHAALAGSGLQSYADHTASEAFEHAASELERRAATTAVTVMCAERDPLSCHRSLIADWLLLRGARVVHLLDAYERREHALRPEARRVGEQLVYDRGAQGSLL